MKAAKFLVSTVATAAVVGALGFTYAQTGSYNMGDSTSTPKAVDEPQGPSGSMNSGSNSGASNADEKSDSLSTSTTASGDSSATAEERMARSDRN